MNESPNRDRVAVVGLGLLGKGIAACFVSHGFEVVGYSPKADELKAIRSEVEAMVTEVFDGHGNSTDPAQTADGRLHLTSTIADCRGASFVVESVPEDVATKQAVHADLEKLVDDVVVIATNTSSIPISRLQQGMRLPNRLVGMHWAEPAHRTRFMELVRGDLTDEGSFAAAKAMGRRLGKDPIACQKDVPGFIVNRIAYAMYREACYLIEAGVADAETIDRGLRNSLGLWANACGPFRWIDLTGGPMLYAQAMAHVLPSLCNSVEVSSTMRKLADERAMGIVDGHGFYDYSPEQAEAWRDRFHRCSAEATAILDREFPLESGGGFSRVRT
jgi:3-hydroxybutyryl-CoA dehydrogenase